MAKEIFLGFLGAFIGVMAVAIVGSQTDPDQKYSAGWSVLLVLAAILGSSGMLWLGELL